jgi:hypothetical protein
MVMGMEAKDEGSKGASLHGGFGTLAPIYLWCSYLLGGGCTIGRGCTPSGHELYLAVCCLVCFVGEVAHKSIFVCKGFFYKALRSKGARLEWH